MVGEAMEVEGAVEGLFIGEERRWRGGAAVAGRRASRATINGARRRGAVVRAARPAQDDETGRAGAERQAVHPGRVGAQGCTCSAWAQGVCAWARSRKEKREEGRKEKGKRKGEKEREEKGEKEEEAPAGFAALVASRAWRRREATCTRNEENRKSLNDV